MGVRGHIETTQPEYNGNLEISSWWSDQARDFLLEKGVELWDNDGMSDEWEIQITDELETLVEDLISEKVDFEGKLSGDLKGQHYGRALGKFLEEGLDIAKMKKYSTIRISWF